MDERLASPDDYYAAYLRSKKGLILGTLLVVLAGCFSVFFLSEKRKIAYVKSHSPVTATITSKAELRGRGYYTRVTIDYWRETSHGLVHCSVSKNLPEWSSNYDLGKTLDIFPKEENCYEPYTVVPGEGSPTVLIVCAISLFLIGGVLIGKGYASTPQP